MRPTSPPQDKTPRVCMHGHKVKTSGCVSCELLWAHSSAQDEPPDVIRDAIVQLMNALDFYADHDDGWALTEHADAYEDAKAAFDLVSQQAQQLYDVGEALDGQYPSDKPCVARAVQQQRKALDKANDTVKEQAQQIATLLASAKKVAEINQPNLMQEMASAVRIAELEAQVATLTESLAAMTSSCEVQQIAIATLRERTEAAEAALAAVNVAAGDHGYAPGTSLPLFIRSIASDRNAQIDERHQVEAALWEQGCNEQKARMKAEAALAGVREELEEVRSLVDDILEERADDLDADACNRCEECSELVMCGYHSLLSALTKRTWTTPAIDRANLQASLTSYAEGARQIAQFTRHKSGCLRFMVVNNKRVLAPEGAYGHDCTCGLAEAILALGTRS